MTVKCKHRLHSREKRNRSSQQNLQQQVLHLQSHLHEYAKEVQAVRLEKQLERGRASTCKGDSDVYSKLCDSNRRVQGLVIRLNESNNRAKQLEVELADTVQELSVLRLELSRSRSELRMPNLDYQTQVRLEKALEHNEDLYAKYTETLRENYALKVRVAALEDRNLALQAREEEAFREAEQKVSHLEMSLSKIQEGSFQTRQGEDSKIQVLSNCVEYLEREFSQAARCLPAVKRRLALEFEPLHTLASLTKFKPMRALIQRLDFGPQLGDLLEGIAGAFLHLFDQASRRTQQALQQREMQLERVGSKLRKLRARPRRGLRC